MLALITLIIDDLMSISFRSDRLFLEKSNDIIFINNHGETYCIKYIREDNMVDLYLSSGSSIDHKSSYTLFDDEIELMDEIWKVLIDMTKTNVYEFTLNQLDLFLRLDDKKDGWFIKITPLYQGLTTSCYEVR